MLRRRQADGLVLRRFDANCLFSPLQCASLSTYDTARAFGIQPSPRPPIIIRNI